MRTLDAAFQPALAGHLPRYGALCGRCRKRFYLLPPDQMLSVYVPTLRVGSLGSRSAWRIMISRQWGIESTKANSARGSTVACTSGSVIAVFALKRGR